MVLIMSIAVSAFVLSFKQMSIKLARLVYVLIQIVQNVSNCQSLVMYRIKPEELSFLALKKAEAEGRGFFQS